MRPVLELLKQRDPTNWSLSPQQSVFDALQIFLGATTWAP